MNYPLELKKFMTSQNLNAALRITLAVVIPSIILAQLGILKEFFLFPLATSFIGLTDQTGPFIRRRNTLFLATFCFLFVATIASLLKNYLPLIYLEIIVFGVFFSMIGVYGQRLAAVGGITLVVFSIFIDGHLTGSNVVESLLIFLAGCLWFILIFFVVVKLQPYKLASQLIGENYLELADYLKIKAKFYLKNTDYDHLYRELIAKQVVIKNLQEETREVVFKTRIIVNEATTTSRLLMLMFLNAIDFYEKLITTDNDYKKIHTGFDDTDILNKIHDYLFLIAEEIGNIGMALQRGTKVQPMHPINDELNELYTSYFQLRNENLTPETLENFMSLRLIFTRIKELSEAVKTIYTIFSQDEKIMKSLSTGLDYQKFIPQQEKLNSKIFFENFSLKSAHFRFAIRITLALVLGYAISQLNFLGIGHSYWILITIVAIMRPAYSTTKHRNLLRIYGTIGGAIIAYLFLIFIKNEEVLFALLLSSMILCFSLLKSNYAWAVFFMTIYIFITFNFLNPGHVNIIFKDRILDTFIGAVLVSLVSYFVLPLWERSQNLDLMKATAKSNYEYFKVVCHQFYTSNNYNVQDYKMKRKNAIISLANLSDNFQRMISDPKTQREKLEKLHQFVNTSHLITAYTASLSQYGKQKNNFQEIDFENWEQKIASELFQTIALLNDQKITIETIEEPEDLVDEMLIKRKTELRENEFFDRRDPNRISRLTLLKNIQEILELLSDVVHEQRKITENYFAKN